MELFIKLLICLLSLASFKAYSFDINVTDKDIDATNQYIATKWDQINRSVDMFFTEQNTKTAENKSSVFVYGSFYKKEGQKIDNKFDFQLKFDFPNTTKKLKIVIEKEQDDISNAISDTSVSTNKELTKDGRVVNKSDNNYTAGADYFLTQTEYFVSFIHFGIRLDMPLNPNLKLDLVKDYKTNFMNIGLSQKFIYYRQEGFQNISHLSLNKKLTEKLQTDFVNSIVWSDETDEFVFRHNLLLYQNLGKEKTLSYSIGANAKFSPTYYYDSYDASISYRQLLYHDWLYATFTYGADFPKVSHYRQEQFLQFRVDIFFKEK